MSIWAPKQVFNILKLFWEALQLQNKRARGQTVVHSGGCHREIKFLKASTSGGTWRGWRCAALHGKAWAGGAGGAKPWRATATTAGRQQHRGPWVPVRTPRAPAAPAVPPVHGTSTGLLASPGIGMLALAFCISV